MDTIYSTITKKIPSDMGEHVDTSITLQELATAIAQAPKKKSPGDDGIIAEFYN